jgi:hypothetical protein
MNRRQALAALLAAFARSSAAAATPSVPTLIGTGSRGTPCIANARRHMSKGQQAIAVLAMM